MDVQEILIDIEHSDSKKKTFDKIFGWFFIYKKQNVEAGPITVLLESLTVGCKEIYRYVSKRLDFKPKLCLKRDFCVS